MQPQPLSKNGLVSLDNLLASGEIVEDIDRSDDDIRHNEMVQGAGQISNLVTCIKMWMCTLENVANNENWKNILRDNIKKHTLEALTKAAKYYHEFLYNPQKPISKSEAQILAVSFFCLGRILIKEHQLNCFKIGLLLQAYFIGILDSSPDLSGRVTLQSLLDDNVIQNEFDALVRSTTIEQWLEHTKHLNHFEIVLVAKSMRHMANQYDDCLSQNDFVADKFYYLLTDNLYRFTFLLLKGSMQDLYIDRAKIYSELDKLINRGYLLWCEERAESTEDERFVIYKKEMIAALEQFKPRSTHHAEKTKAKFRLNSPGAQQTMIDRQQYILNDEVPSFGEELKGEFFKYAGFLGGKLHNNVIFSELYPSRSQYHNQNSQRAPENRIAKLLYNYFKGFLPLSELGLTPANAMMILQDVKLFNRAAAYLSCTSANIYFPVSSFEVKQDVLRLRPDLEIPGVMINTLGPRISDAKSWLESDMWPTEHMGKLAKATVNMFISIRSLSERLKIEEPQGVLIALRGTTGSRKTSFIAQTYGRSGKSAANPDGLKEEFEDVFRNAQGHRALALFFNKKLYPELAASNLSFIRDSRLSDLDDVVEDVIKPAILGRRVVRIYDFDVGSFFTSANAVYSRSAKKVCPTKDGVTSGFVRNRGNRAEIIKMILKERIVKVYELFYRGKRIAYKKEDYLEIDDKCINEYLECLREPSEREIQAFWNRKIDAKYIEEAMERNDLYPYEYQKLEYWKEQQATVGEALARHALGEG